MGRSCSGGGQQDSTRWYRWIGSSREQPAPAAHVQTSTLARPAVASADASFGGGASFGVIGPSSSSDDDAVDLNDASAGDDESREPAEAAEAAATRVALIALASWRQVGRESDAIEIRPSRVMYTWCSSRSVSTWAAVRPEHVNMPFWVST